MKFTSMELVGVTTIKLPIVGLKHSDRYILKAVDGTGPPEISVSISNLLDSGGAVQNSQPNLRQLVLKVGLTPSWAQNITASDLRDELYGLLSSPGLHNKITINFMSDSPLKPVVAKTQGVVSRLETVPFGQKPEVQITIDCDSAYLEATEDITIVAPAYDNIIEFENQGTAPSGFVLETTLGANRSYLTFGIPTPQGDSYIGFDREFKAGDEIFIDTNPDSLNATVKEFVGGQTKTLLDSMRSESQWLKLHGGTNQVRVYTDVLSFSLTYRPKFWGV